MACWTRMSLLNIYSQHCQSWGLQTWRALTQRWSTWVATAGSALCNSVLTTFDPKKRLDSSVKYMWPRGTEETGLIRRERNSHKYWPIAEEDMYSVSTRQSRTLSHPSEKSPATVPLSPGDILCQSLHISE